jgi:hypothetical protein
MTKESMISRSLIALLAMTMWFAAAASSVAQKSPYQMTDLEQLIAEASTSP